jgi:hypothetical protein
LTDLRESDHAPAFPLLDPGILESFVDEKRTGPEVSGIEGEEARRRIPLRGRLSYLSHLFKCVARQDHTQFLPVLRRMLDSDAVVLDVGSHGGQYCKLFARLVPDGRVHAFEPGSYARSILTWVVRLHRLSNVSVHPLALGELATELALNVPVKSSGSIGYGLSQLVATTTGER